jgi:DNA-binding NarL/FixJ family response regulator
MAEQCSRILIVDDHPLVCAGLRSMVEAEADLTLCGEVGTVREAFDTACKARPDLAVIDLSLSDGSGIELIKRLKGQMPGLKMLVCSMYDEQLYAERAISAGAQGYVNKHEGLEEILRAIHQVLAGRVYLSEPMVERVVNGFAKTRDTGRAGVDDLTDRELEVFSLIGQGLSTSKIAEQLHLSVKTVETHREKIKRKLQLPNGSQLVRFAVEWHIEQV